MEQNVSESNRNAVDIKDNSAEASNEDLEPEPIQHVDAMFDESKPHFVVAMTDIKRSDAVQLFQKFDYDLDAMVSHLYIEESKAGQKIIKFIDPRFIKKMVL